MAEEREFIDELEHSGADRYQEIIDGFDGNEDDVDAFVDNLYDLIEEDPFYCDPYLALVQLNEEAGLHDESARLLEEAYKKAVELITENGTWPDLLEWIFPENRHIIRTLTSRSVL